ncbi:MAG: hypothetical protein ACK5QC_03345 [Bacteroidota bacterium]
MYRYLFKLIFCSLMIVSCNDNKPVSENKLEIGEKPFNDSLNTNRTIDQALNNISHKTKSKWVGDTLQINLLVDKDDYISEHYIEVLTEVIVCDVSEILKPNCKIKLIECTEFESKNTNVEIINNEMIQKILSVNKVKIYYDFKKYIVNNIKGEKLVKLNLIIEKLIKDRKSVESNPLSKNDFIIATMEYATKYCLPSNKNDFYRKLLLAIKEISIDKELWPDFNPKDVDYFLDYCNTNT